MATGTYTQFTLADAYADLGRRLFDPEHVRWTTPELTLYVQQALRTFNALTNHYRSEATFQTDVNQPFYDLPTVLPALRAQTYTVRSLIDQICYHLLEPVPTGGLWRGTEQYSLEDILSAVRTARDSFLRDTGIVQAFSTLAVNPFPSTGIVELEEEIINVRRLAWQTANGIITVLKRNDQWSMTNFGVNWQTVTTRPPKTYSISTQPPLQVQLAPLSSVAGTLHRITVNTGAVPDILDVTQSLGVPNDWAWVVGFGALYQLFARDGLALDPGRAAYCQQRWDHGIAAARQAAVVLAAQIEGQTVTLGSIQDADVYSPSWQMMSAVPRKIMLAGHTIVATYPPPGVPEGGGSFEVLLQVVRNAPVPVSPTDDIQVGSDVIDALMDYAQHLAMLKEGSAQLQANDGILKAFMEMCGTTIDLQYASQPAELAATGQTTQDANKLAYMEQRP